MAQLKWVGTNVDPKKIKVPSKQWERTAIHLFLVKSMQKDLNPFSFLSPQTFHDVFCETIMTMTFSQKYKFINPCLLKSTYILKSKEISIIIFL